MVEFKKAKKKSVAVLYLNPIFFSENLLPKPKNWLHSDFIWIYLVSQTARARIPTCAEREKLITEEFCNTFDFLLVLNEIFIPESLEITTYDRDLKRYVSRSSSNCAAR